MSTQSVRHSLGISRRFARRMVRLYYGRIEVTDADRMPQSGPVLICANHANSLLDPVLLGIASRRPVRFMAKAPLFDSPVLGPVMRALGMIPAYRGSDDQAEVRRNLESLEVGAKVLKEGEAMGIFPEGRSHDFHTVEMIRSGAARMALQAVEEGAKGLKVVPVGLNYEDKEAFRSAVWIRVGEPIDVEACLAESNGNERLARKELTARLEQGLKKVVIHLDDPKWQPFLDDLEVLVPRDPKARQETIYPLKQRKWLADAMNHFQREGNPQAAEAASAIRDYREHVGAAGVEVDSPVLQTSGWRMVLMLVWQSLWMLLFFLPALVGTFFHIVPFTIVRAISSRLQPPGRTTVSMSRLCVGLPIYLLWYLAVWWWLFYDFRAAPWFAWTCLAALPFLGLLALGYWRAVQDVAGLWWHQCRFLFDRGQLSELRRERDALSTRLSRLGEEYEQISPRPGLPRKASAGELLLRFAPHAALLLAALAIWWYVPRLLFDRPLIAREAGFDLTTLTAEELDFEMQRDAAALKDIIQGLGELETKAHGVQAEFAAGIRNYDNEADNDAVRQLLLSYCNYRTALLRIIWKYLNHDELATEQERLEAFLLDYTAALVLCESSLKFVHSFNRSPETIARLNEGEPKWGIPAGMYDTVQKNLASQSSIRQLASAGEFYRRMLPHMEEIELGGESEFASFHAAIERANSTIEKLGGADWLEKFNIASKDLEKLIATVKYDTQAVVSTWIGDVKIKEPRAGVSLIPAEQVERLKPLLKPGDVLIERRNWYVSNAFLPGYWPHAALYVGTAEDLRALGLEEDRYVKKHLAEFALPDHEGRARVIIEALSEGVVFSSLEHSIGGGDSAAVLRPKLGEEQIRQAISLAFSHVGKPYDFEFDFKSHDKLVCTEVVYRAYGANLEQLQFPLKRIMGRTTMPAIEIVRKFKEELESNDPQFELIAFIDGDERTSAATFSTDPAKFVATLDRPALTLFQDIAHEPIPGFGRLGWGLLALILLVTLGNLVYYAQKPRRRTAAS